MRMRASPILCIALLAILQCVLGGQYITYSYMSRNNGLWIPTASGSGPLPLFVMLHGCTQNPSDFAAGTGMNGYCDTYRCFVLYPEQPSSANSNKCWNWFETKDQARDAGEPKLIVDMAKSLFSKYNIDTSRIFVGGLSAGAAMSVILAATHPDVFRGAAVGAGLEYKAATSMIQAFTAMSSGGPSPVTQGQLAYKAAGTSPKLLPIFVVHGTSDGTVAPINGKQVVSQFATTLDLVLGGGSAKGYLTDTPTTTTNGQVPSGGRAYTLYTYVDKLYGLKLMQYVTVTGMAHAWSGGSSSGSYTDPKGPNASVMMIEYFYNFTNNPTPTTSSSTTTSSTAASVATTSSSTTATSGTVTTGSSTTGGGKVSVFTSIGAEDGFVGKIAADGFSASTCKIGDSGMYNIDTYRTILSFDTTTLPAGVQILEAVLKIHRVSMTGALKPLLVDIKSGTFGSTTKLEQMSYHSAPSVLNIGSIAIPEGDTSTFLIPASSLQYVRAGTNGRCQIKLREDPTNSITFANNLLEIVDGGATLTVTHA